MRRLILSPDFPDWVLFEAGAPVDLDGLPLSSELREALSDWYGQWSRLDNEYQSEMPSDAKIDWTAFDIAGIELWQRLQHELADGFAIAFYSHRFRERFENPQELTEILRNHLNA